jgi:hypothetical protein
MSADATRRGSRGHRRKRRRAPLCPDVTAPLSVTGAGGRDEGCPGKISTACGASNKGLATLASGMEARRADAKPPRFVGAKGTLMWLHELIRRLNKKRGPLCLRKFCLLPCWWLLTFSLHRGWDFPRYKRCLRRSRCGGERRPREMLSAEPALPLELVCWVFQMSPARLLTGLRISMDVASVLCVTIFIVCAWWGYFAQLGYIADPHVDGTQMPISFMLYDQMPLSLMLYIYDGLPFIFGFLWLGWRYIPLLQRKVPTFRGDAGVRLLSMIIVGFILLPQVLAHLIGR